MEMRRLEYLFISSQKQDQANIFFLFHERREIKKMIASTGKKKKRKRT